MSASYVTYDTLTIGLGDDERIGDAVALAPPPVLARTPKVHGGPRRGVGRGSSPAPLSELASFQVTTTAVEDRPEKPAAVQQRVIRHDSPAPSPAVKVVVEQPEEDWSTTLLKMQSSGRPIGKLLITLLLAAVAGATLVLFRSPSETNAPQPIEPPSWSSAPLAEAPLFRPEPLPEATEGPVTVPPSFVGPDLIVAPPAIGATGPIGIAKQERPAPPNADVDQSLTPAKPHVKADRVAALPSPYPSTEYPVPSTGPARDQPAKPSARLTGIRALPATPPPSQLR